MFSGADGTRNALNRGAERPLTAFVSHDSPAESTCRAPSGPPELPNPGISPKRAPKGIVVSGAVGRDPRSPSPGYPLVVSSADRFVVSDAGPLVVSDADPSIDPTSPESWFRVQLTSWFQVRGRSWFRMQPNLRGFGVVTGAAPSVVSDAVDSCLRMQKHVVSKAPQTSNHLISLRQLPIFLGLTP